MYKPLIRHCKNCKFNDDYKEKDWDSSDIWCRVKYKRINHCEQRKQALFCPHYKKKRGKHDYAV